MDKDIGFSGQTYLRNFNRMLTRQRTMTEPNFMTRKLQKQKANPNHQWGSNVVFFAPTQQSAITQSPTTSALTAELQASPKK